MALLLRRCSNLLHNIRPQPYFRIQNKTYSQKKLEKITTETEYSGELGGDISVPIPGLQLYPVKAAAKVGVKHIIRKEYSIQPDNFDYDKQQKSIDDFDHDKQQKSKQQKSIENEYHVQKHLVDNFGNLTSHSSIKNRNDDKVQYDFIVDCDTIQNLNDGGWDIFANKIDLWHDKVKGYTFDQRQSIRRVAVSGVYNTGKTYFLGKLCGMELPDCDDSFHTKGISMKQLASEDRMLIIDTAGSSSAIEIANDNALSDKIISEKILQNVLYEIANFHICVVKELTWPDQHHFESLYKQIQQSQSENKSCVQQWPLIVVHNFRWKNLEYLHEYLSSGIEELYRNGKFKSNRTDHWKVKPKFLEMIKMFIQVQNNKCIKNKTRKNEEGWVDARLETRDYTAQELKKMFRGNDVPNFWFDSRGGDSHLNQLRHFFIVNGDTVIGDVYNQFVFDQIKDIITTTPMSSDPAMYNQNQSEEIVPPDQFCINDLFKSLDKNVTQFVQFVKRQQTTETIVNPEKSVIPNLYSFVPCENIEEAKDDQIKLILDPKLVDDEGAEIKLRDSNELEYNALFIGATGWVLKYDVHYTDDTCTVIMELPGTNVHLDHPHIKHNEANQPQLIITGTRDPEPESYNDIGLADISQRKFGIFTFKIGIQKEFGNEIELPTYSSGKGVVKVVMKKASKPEITRKPLT